MFHMSFDLCRYCLTTMLCRPCFRLMFSQWRMLDCKSIFEYIEMEENTMCFDEAQDATIFLKRKKTLLSLFSVLCQFVFKIDGFLGL
jgi:hypothetical protein